jgi:hypothetical protein
MLTGASVNLVAVAVAVANVKTCFLAQRLKIQLVFSHNFLLFPPV